MRRGELWTITDHEAVVVVSSNRLHENDFPIAYALPLQPEAPKGLEPPYVVRFTPSATGLKIETWAHAYAIKTVRSSDLTRKLGMLSDPAIRLVDDALRDLLQL